MARKHTRRWVLAGAAMAVAGGIALREYRLIPPDYAGGQLTVAQAFAQAQSGAVLLIDIRTPKEWRASGIGQGAHAIDMRRTDFTEAVGQLVDGNRDRPIALICARGVRSARMSNLLTKAGFTNIIDVPEGMLGSAAGPGWIRAGLPVTTFEGDT